MKKLLLCLLFIILFPCRSVLATSSLLRLDRTHTRESTQIYLTFDILPVYSVNLREKRLDITLESTRPAKNLEFFAADTRIIKILPLTSADRTVISFFFRHKPQSMQTEKSKEGKLIVEIMTDSQFNPADHIVKRQLKDITPLDEKAEASPNPLENSPYAQNWRQFFADYESELSYSVPVHYTIPPFPLINLLPSLNEKGNALLPPEVTELANRGSWQEIKPLLLELLKIATDPEQQKRINLTLGEVLLRNDAFADANEQLSMLAKEYKEEPVGIFAGFLLVLLQANKMADFPASAEIMDISKTLGPASPLLPHLVLFEIESALAADDFKKAQLLLDRPDIAYPDETQKIRELRQADLFVGLKQPLKAYVSYHLLKDTGLINRYPDSLKGYCETLYFHKKFKEAGECYTRLIPLVEDKEALSLINFRKAMAETKISPESPNIEVFSLVEDAYPGMEAGYRAALKKTDLQYLKDENRAENAITAYHGLSEKAVLRAVVAEASFKEALANRLLGRNSQALVLLQHFLRDFRSGDLRPTAQALVIDILPNEIKGLVAAKKFPEALVLAKENKEFFQKGWLDIRILSDLAFSYRQIGLYNHAREMYLYIMDIAKVEQREQYYLPLLETVYEQGDNKQVEYLADRYFNTYPHGPHLEEILILRLNALIVEGQLPKAQGLLPSPLPLNDRIQAIAATLSFQSDKYPETLSYIRNISEVKRASAPELVLMEGESLFQTGDMGGSEKAYSHLREKNYHFEQVHYRLAQIELGKGNTENALKLFRQIVDKGENSQWKKYAEKELEYVDAMDRLQRKLDN